MTYLGANILTDALNKVVDKAKDKVSSVTSGDSDLMNSMTGAATSQAAGVVAANRSYQINRERFAVAAKSGYDWLDRYTAAKPTLFIVGIIGLIASGYAIYKRRKQGTEAITLYSMTGLASGALAFIAKPGMSTAAKDAPAVASTSPSALKSVMAWADKKGDALSRSSPGWESETLKRVWSDVGQGPLQPAVNVLLTKNAH